MCISWYNNWVQVFTFRGPCIVIYSYNDYIVVAGDYNARLGNIPIDGILDTNGEITANSNGHKLEEFTSKMVYIY